MSRGSNSLSLSDLLLNDYEEKLHDIVSNKACLTSKNLEQPAWTSLQYTEAFSVLSKFLREKNKICSNCGNTNPTFKCPTFGWLKMEMKDSDIRQNIIGGSNLNESEIEFVKQKNSSNVDLVPTEVRDILQHLWENELRICSLIFNFQRECLSSSTVERGYNMFIMEALLVPPSKFRPPSKGNKRGDVLEHPQNVLLSKVLECNSYLLNSVSSGFGHSAVIKTWTDLQKSVNVLFDSSKGIAKSERDTVGIRQLLEKKAGIFRQKMMGKRVNFACRSVISPDPYLAVNEIGIPPHFALRLTYPERVTPWNVDKLRRTIINGTEIHPGATHYKDKDHTYKLQSGRVSRVSISRKLPTSRSVPTHSGKSPESEFEGKIVYRHLRDGDIVLVNRQPTLHKPSMMAHIVRVLKGEKTLRMHYANCSTYNADFDGDEMNVHLPQDEISRAEAINLANANKQYVVPTSGNPIRGLIQDHIISAVLLTKKDSFLTRDEYNQLLYASCVPAADSSTSLCKVGQKVSILNSEDEMEALLPAIWKPGPLWTGKQVITAILNHVTRGHSPFTVANTVKIPKEYLGNDRCEFEFLVHENEFVHGVLDKNQFVKYGLVHTVHELYGPDTAGILLSAFSRLFTVFLQMHGFTCGVDDLLIDPRLDVERKRILENCEKRSKEVHCKFILAEDGYRDPRGLQLEIENIIRNNGEPAITRLDHMMSNALNHLTSELNKILFPGGLQKSLPRNCLSLMTTTGAKGGLVNFTQISSLLGQQELEGKRVPRMVSGKTLPCFPPWDIASRAGGFIGDRFLTGLRPQEYYFHCMAGRDGLVDTAIKTSRSGYLQRCLIKNLESLKVSYDHTVRDVDGSVIQFLYGEDGVDVHQNSFLMQFEALDINQNVVQERLNSHNRDADLKESNAYVKHLPYKLKREATTFLHKLSKKQRGSLHLKRQKNLMKLVKLKYLSSLVQPGEPVGVLAAQSVGEPSTQMTLNTFHFAGRGEMNVTLGIPRLQEILMTAKEKIRTPIMACPVHDFITREAADHLATKMRRITVAEIVESMEVCIVPFCALGREVASVYKLHLKLYSPQQYPPYSDVSQEKCERTLKYDYVEALERAIEKHLKAISKISSIQSVSNREEDYAVVETGEDEPDTKASQQGEENDDGDGYDDEIADDQGADAQKRRRQVNDEVDYEDDIEKENYVLSDEHGGEEPSGFESEIDQVEDEHYTLGGEVQAQEAVGERNEDPSQLEHMSTSKTASEEPQSEARKRNRARGTKNMDNKAIFIEVRGLDFEVHFTINNESHILLAEIAQKVAKRVCIKDSRNIEQCSVTEDKVTKRIALETAGVNFRAFWDLEEYLDINHIRSNDIHAILNTYGVEAARSAIINEVKNVFDYYKISVDIRHLSLIADFMTANGDYRPMNRIGVFHSTSPFSKMTFETATKFIVQAASHGEVDMLESPSASVCLGQPVKMGTGCFDLMQNLLL
uniref:DNA-directed RNA polymerase subunit n=1 Tax=Anthurium amnicola TaxID=1678845 RepID=A0A1D1Z0S6_9ARAE